MYHPNFRLQTPNSPNLEPSSPRTPNFQDPQPPSSKTPNPKAPKTRTHKPSNPKPQVDIYSGLCLDDYDKDRGLSPFGIYPDGRYP